jgi:hypothetical protein
MEKLTLQLSKEQLLLISKALDFYSRVGIGQFDEIKNHPTFERHLSDVCRPKKEPEVGDKTPQGKILEIEGGKALIAGSVKDGVWNKEHEWKTLKDVKLSTDYTKYHNIRERVDLQLNVARNMLYNDHSISIHGSWGIYHPSVDESCREAYDLHQDIRHFFWNQQEEKSSMTVDSSVHYSSKKHSKIDISKN